MHSQGTQAEVAPSWTVLCGDLVNKTQSLALSSLKVNSLFPPPPGTEDKTTILGVAEAVLCGVFVCLLFFHPIPRMSVLCCFILCTILVPVQLKFLLRFHQLMLRVTKENTHIPFISV